MNGTLVALILLSLAYVPATAQTNKNVKPPVQTKLIALQPDEPKALAVNGGSVRFLVDGADTGGAWSLAEVTEMPGYKTPLHRHDWDESFYVLEGVLTVKTEDKIQELAAGAYVLIPRGTPHGQANFSQIPVKALLLMTPSGFEQHLKDRVELFKTVKPDNPEFAGRLDKLRQKNARYMEILGSWDAKK